VQEEESQVDSLRDCPFIALAYIPDTNFVHIYSNQRSLRILTNGIIPESGTTKVVP